jgi:hypothetical protein
MQIKKGRAMHRRIPGARQVADCDIVEMSSPPQSSWLFAEALRGNSLRVFRVPPSERSMLDRFVDEITCRAPPEVGHATYFVVRESYLFAQGSQGKPVDRRLQGAVDVTYQHMVTEADWKPADHPRSGYPQNRGWFSPTAGGGSGMPSETNGETGFSSPDYPAGGLSPRRGGFDDGHTPQPLRGAILAMNADPPKQGATHSDPSSDERNGYTEQK